MLGVFKPVCRIAGSAGFGYCRPPTYMFNRDRYGAIGLADDHPMSAAIESVSVPQY